VADAVIKAQLSQYFNCMSARRTAMYVQIMKAKNLAASIDA
jgi:hypothetical protein